MSGARLLMNVLVFQAAWVGAVAGAAAGRFWLGPAAALAAAAMHLAATAGRARELAALAAVTVLGTAWDVVPALVGLIDYRGGLAVLGGVPLWLAGLWLAFATTLNVSLRWLRRRLVLAGALGAVGGPLSFLAAERLGALTFVAPLGALAAQAAGWAVLLPVVSAVAARCDGTRAGPERRDV